MKAGPGTPVRTPLERAQAGQDIETRAWGLHWTGPLRPVNRAPGALGPDPGWWLRETLQDCPHGSDACPGPVGPGPLSRLGVPRLVLGGLQPTPEDPAQLPKHVRERRIDGKPLPKPPTSVALGRDSAEELLGHLERLLAWRADVPSLESGSMRTLTRHSLWLSGHGLGTPGAHVRLSQLDPMLQEARMTLDLGAVQALAGALRSALGRLQAYLERSGSLARELRALAGAATPWPALYAQGLGPWRTGPAPQGVIVHGVVLIRVMERQYWAAELSPLSHGAPDWTWARPLRMEVLAPAASIKVPDPRIAQAIEDAVRGREAELMLAGDAALLCGDGG